MQPTSTFDVAPPGSYALLRAISWLRDLLLGSLGVSVAVLAIAAIGLLALTGRIDLRRALAAVLGCFVLFGAPVIAAGLFRIGTGARLEQPEVVPSPPPPAIEPARAPPPPVPTSDPYAGAAVPQPK